MSCPWEYAAVLHLRVITIAMTFAQGPPDSWTRQRGGLMIRLSWVRVPAAVPGGLRAEYVSRLCRGTVHHVYVRRSKIRKHRSRGCLQNGSSLRGGRPGPGSRPSATPHPARPGRCPASGRNARCAWFAAADLRRDFLWAVLCAFMCVALPGRRLTVGPRQSGQALPGFRPRCLERGRAPP